MKKIDILIIINIYVLDKLGITKDNFYDYVKFEILYKKFQKLS